MDFGTTEHHLNSFRKLHLASKLSGCVRDLAVSSSSCLSRGTLSKGLSRSAKPYLYTSSELPYSPYVLWISWPAINADAATICKPSLEIFCKNGCCCPQFAIVRGDMWEPGKRVEHQAFSRTAVAEYACALPMTNLGQWYSVCHCKG